MTMQTFGTADTNKAYVSAEKSEYGRGTESEEAIVSYDEREPVPHGITKTMHVHIHREGSSGGMV